MKVKMSALAAAVFLTLTGIEAGTAQPIRGAVTGAAVGGLVGGGRGAAIGAVTGSLIARHGRRVHGGYYWYRGHCYYNRRHTNGWYRVHPRYCR